MLYHLLCTARLCIAHFRAVQLKPCVILVSKLCACYRWQQLAGPSAASPVSPLPAHQRINTLGVTVMVLLTQGICTTASNSCASKGRLHAQQQSHDPVSQIITPIADSEGWVFAAGPQRQSETADTRQRWTQHHTAQLGN